LVRARLCVGWRYFWLGALTFFLFQMVTRVPLVHVAQTHTRPRLHAESTFALAQRLEQYSVRVSVKLLVFSDFI
jgi:hypothetical protein